MITARNIVSVLLGSFILLFGYLFVTPFVNAEGQSLTLCVGRSGSVYVIGGGFRLTSCRGSDQLVTLPLGEGGQGPVGPSGPQGVGGPAGANGTQGAKGDKGEKGDQGGQGPAGPAGSQGAQGVAGAQGPQGPKGDSGAAGGGGSSGATRVAGDLVTSAVNIGSGNQLTATVTCPEGKVLLGGGAEVKSSTGTQNGSTLLSSSYPSSETTWTAVGTVRATMTGGSAMTVQAFALCSL